jgi:hypothetical protein
MLAKCASPLCSASFFHLADGRLFRLETEPDFPSSNARATEYFWLCEPCSALTTLRLADDGTVGTTKLADALGNRPHVALNSVDRGSRAFLSTVSFLSRSHPKGT